MSHFVACYSVLWSCLVFVPVLCPDSPWLLFYRSKYQALAAAPKLCPGLTLTILLFSSTLLFPTVWTITSALLTPVLSINVTPLIIQHLGLSLVNWCDKTLTACDVPSAASKLSMEYGKAYIQQIEILHYIDFVRKKYDLSTVVYIVALLYSGITSL